MRRINQVGRRTLICCAILMVVALLLHSLR